MHKLMDSECGPNERQGFGRDIVQLLNLQDNVEKLGLRLLPWIFACHL